MIQSLHVMGSIDNRISKCEMQLSPSLILLVSFFIVEHGLCAIQPEPSNSLKKENNCINYNIFSQLSLPRGVSESDFFSVKLLRNYYSKTGLWILSHKH